MTAPELQPPEQKYNERPPVIADPCTWIDPDTEKRAGLAGAPRRRNDAPGEHTFLGCAFQPPDVNVNVLMTNVSEEEIRQRDLRRGDAITSLTVNGRPGHRGIEKGTAGVCSVTLAYGTGALDITVTLSPLYPGETPDPCARAVQIATVLEPRITAGLG